MSLTFQIQWQLDGMDVPGSTANTFGPITTAQRGKRLGFRLIATGSNGLPSTPVYAPPVLIPAAGPALTISGIPATTAAVGTPYSFTPTAAGGTPPYTFSMPSGALPAGLSFNPLTGAITGTPTTAQTQTNLVITVTDSVGATASLPAFSIAVTAVSGLVLTAPTSTGSPYTGLYAPTTRDAFVSMTPTVAQNDEALDVMLVCGTPYSPDATSITLSGADAVWFESYLNSKIVYKASTRASVPRNGYLTLTVNSTNAQGDSDVSTLSVWVPADADCVFVSYATGGTSGLSDGSLAHPWKYCPRTMDFSGGPLYSSGQTIFFEGGTHRTQLLQNLWPAYEQPPHSGSPSKPIRYAFTGWKGQAKFSGAVTEAGSWSASSSGDCYNSPSIASLTTLTVATAVQRYQMVFWGDVMGRLSQYPRPTNLRKNEDALLAASGGNNFNGVTSDGGMKQIFYTTNSGDTTAVRFFFNTGGTNCYIQDAALDARFNNANATYNANGVGFWLKIWDAQNNVDYVNILSYDVATHRATFNAPSIGMATVGGYTAYAMMGSPYDVQVSTQYAMSPDGLKVIAYRPVSPGQASISRLQVGGGVGRKSDTVYHQFWFEAYSGSSTTRTGSGLTTSLGGTGLHARSDSLYTGIRVYGMKVYHCNNEDENGLGLDMNQVGATDGLQGPILDRLHFSDNLRGRGFQTTGYILGLTTGSGPNGFPTQAEVHANPDGKCRWWFVEEDSLSRTVFFTAKMRGMEFVERVVHNFNTVHGDGDAWYPFSAGYFTDHNLCTRDYWDNVLRAKTTSIDSSTYNPSGGLNNWYNGVVALGYQVDANVGWSLFSGDPGGLYTSCIFLQSSRSTAAPGLPCMWMKQGFINMKIQYSILNGAMTDLTPDVYPATFTLDHNGLTVTPSVPTNWPANDPGNSRNVTNTTQLAIQQTWDGVTIPTPWKSILQAGATPQTVRIGPFWKV